MGPVFERDAEGNVTKSTDAWRELRCDSCLRIGYDAKLGDRCLMTQPNGSRCEGVFRPTSSASAPRGAKCMIIPGAQEAADRRQQARADIGAMIRALGCQLQEPDEDKVTIPVSQKAAHQWLESLRYIERQI